MSQRREPVRLVFEGTEFAAGMRVAAVGARQIHAIWTLHDATWEPIDWSEFD